MCIGLDQFSWLSSDLIGFTGFAEMGWLRWFRLFSLSWFCWVGLIASVYVGWVGLVQVGLIFLSWLQ